MIRVVHPFGPLQVKQTSGGICSWSINGDKILKFSYGPAEDTVAVSGEGRTEHYLIEHRAGITTYGAIRGRCLHSMQKDRAPVLSVYATESGEEIAQERDPAKNRRFLLDRARDGICLLIKNGLVRSNEKVTFQTLVSTPGTAIPAERFQRDYCSTG